MEKMSKEDFMEYMSDAYDVFNGEAVLHFEKFMTYMFVHHPEWRDGKYKKQVHKMVAQN